MNTVQASVGLDATALKLLGVVTMTVDHIGYILCPDLVLLRILGRLAYPIFAYLIAEGCTYSKHKAKYFLAVLGTGLLCSIASYGAEHTLYQSIMITFACSIGLIFLLERALVQRARIHSEQFFFTSTVQSHIAQPSGWDNRGKRRASTDIFPVFHCTAPTQGRLPRRKFGCRPFLRRSGIIPRSVPRFSLGFPYPTRPTGELWYPKSHNLFPIVESGGTGKAKSRRSMPL